MTPVSILRLAFLILGVFPLLSCSDAGSETAPPFHVANGLFDMSEKDTLGLSRTEGAETYTVFRAEAGSAQYNHAAVLIGFKGQLYAMWQSSQQDEDAADTRVLYSVSDDGTEWSAPAVLSAPLEQGIMSSGGWWTDGDTLIAYLLVWPERPGSPDHSYTLYRASTDGQTWSEPKAVMRRDGTALSGVIEQDMRALPDGRILTAVHEAPGLIVSPYYTDDPAGISGWTKGQMSNLPHEGPISRELEPSWYRRADGALVMTFRDQASSHLKLASLSRDRGESWTTPMLTNFPDSRSKQSAGNLPNGTAFQVNNPSTDKTRLPLVLTLSEDGVLFDQAFLLRSREDLPPQRYEGKYKREGYSYPKSLVQDGWLYVAYATNKEDIEITRVPISSLTAPN
ncbi:sialidase family protein [Parvularcula marina]|uniref:sialidase family protein n=1 Tax=Parvularcula marina TaxID=2292771 RepID=UPI003516ED67